MVSTNRWASASAWVDSGGATRLSRAFGRGVPN
jgi:hypothetical protein